MASKLPFNTILLLRRSYAAVAAENVIVQPAAAAASVMMKKNVSPTSVEKEEFWMRDPKTGNWIPESQFNQIDAVDLRDKFLTKKDVQSS